MVLYKFRPRLAYSAAVYTAQGRLKNSDHKILLVIVSLPQGRKHDLMAKAQVIGHLLELLEVKAVVIVEQSVFGSPGRSLQR